MNLPLELRKVEELNVLSTNKQTTIQTLLAMGKSQREIARVTGIDRKRGRAYQLRAAANSLGVTTGSVPQPAGQIPPPRPPAHASACEPWREFIEEQLKLRRNAMAIYQGLVDVHGFGHGYNSVKRFVGRLRWREPEQFDRLEFAPGEERRSTKAKARSPSMRRRRKRPRLDFSSYCFIAAVGACRGASWAIPSPEINA